MIKFIFLIILFWQTVSLAQEVTPLFRDNSLFTFVTLPFALKDLQQLPLQIVNLEILSAKENCSTMIDPYINSNFLVKCRVEGPLSVSINFLKNGVAGKINYGPVPILKISSGSIIQPVPIPVVNPINTAAGQQLFVQYCLRCHQNPYDKANRTATRIQNAIATIGQMQSIKLTAAEINSISTYLSNLK